MAYIDGKEVLFSAQVNGVGDLEDGAVTTAKLADGAVTTDKLAEDTKAAFVPAYTGAKLNQIYAFNHERKNVTFPYGNNVGAWSIPMRDSSGSFEVNTPTNGNEKIAVNKGFLEKFVSEKIDNAASNNAVDLTSLEWSNDFGDSSMTSLTKNTLTHTCGMSITTSIICGFYADVEIDVVCYGDDSYSLDRSLTINGKQLYEKNDSSELTKTIKYSGYINNIECYGSSQISFMFNKFTKNKIAELESRIAALEAKLS